MCAILSNCGIEKPNVLIHNNGGARDKNNVNTPINTLFLILPFDLQSRINPAKIKVRAGNKTDALINIEHERMKEIIGKRVNLPFVNL